MTSLFIVLIIALIILAAAAAVAGLFMIFDGEPETGLATICLSVVFGLWVGLGYLETKHDARIEGMNMYLRGQVITDTLHTGEVLYTFKESN